MLSAFDVFVYPLFFTGLAFSAALILEQVDVERDYQDACWQADAYLSALMDELVELGVSRNLPEIRDQMQLFDARLQETRRPEQSWALIPYAEELKARLR